jgi:hypothetical protein
LYFAVSPLSNAIIQRLHPCTSPPTDMYPTQASPFCTFHFLESVLVRLPLHFTASFSSISHSPSRCPSDIFPHVVAFPNCLPLRHWRADRVVGAALEQLLSPRGRPLHDAVSTGYIFPPEILS